MPASKFTPMEDVQREAERLRVIFMKSDGDLSHIQRNIIQRFTSFMRDNSSLERNAIKKRSQVKLKEIWEHSHTLYIVVALSVIYPTRLGSRLDDVHVLGSWWKQVEEPKGLITATKRYSEFLPQVASQGDPRGAPQEDPPCSLQKDPLRSSQEDPHPQRSPHDNPHPQCSPQNDPHPQGSPQDELTTCSLRRKDLASFLQEFDNEEDIYELVVPKSCSERVCIELPDATAQFLILYLKRHWGVYI
ncbi:hypothetical protein GQ44DRAFT_114716 [Phaeosphaeriaceae sp. PMI808]|nr:hypothetical protein GQ44DRAFT_307139 [Phaeosphaeriaceae sp. PMI808]KAH8727444.1 hypothetical protein GQ44DRAFT_114716 [Phaeosphaeriaceae sp. PMI808]